MASTWYNGPSTEMQCYAATGLCPHCGVKLLDSPIPSSVTDSLATQTFLPDSLAPYGAPVSMSRFRSRMTCLVCRQSWPIRRRPFLVDMMSHRGRARGTSPRSVDLTRARILDIRETGDSEERIIQVERHPFTNSSRTSSATKQFEISNSIERAAQIESSNIRTRGGNVGASVLGFGTVMGQLQQQISDRYSLTTSSVITVRESVSVDVGPQSAVELVVQWTASYARGDIQLQTGRWGEEAYVPYRVPVRLTFIPEVRDLPYGQT